MRGGDGYAVKTVGLDQRKYYCCLIVVCIKVSFWMGAMTTSSASAVNQVACTELLAALGTLSFLGLF